MSPHEGTEPRDDADPPWWSAKGVNMEVDGIKLERGKLPLVNIAVGSAARVFITQNNSPRSDFVLQYHIDHVDGSYSQGNVFMDRDDLRRAFGLANGIVYDGDRLVAMGYKLDAACLGRYVRKGNCLNIPHPGTGLPGDPNVSIEVNAEMKSAIRALLDFTAAKAA